MTTPTHPQAAVEGALLDLKPAAPGALAMQSAEAQRWYRMGFEHAKELALAVSAAPTPYTAAQVRRVANDLEAEGLKPRTITLSRAGRMLSAFADAITPPAQEGDKE